MKLRAWLARHGPEIQWPSASTIGEILQRHGLTAPRKKKRRATPSSAPLAHADEANAVWSIDFKGWFRTRDGKPCYPLTISDGFSRYLLRCQALAEPTHERVRPVFEAVFRENGCR